MNFLRLLGATTLLAIGLVSGCSNVKEELKPVELKPIEAQYRFVSQWQRNTGAGQDARYQRLQPTVVDGIIYTVDVNGVVAAWDAKSGKRLWKNDLDVAVGGGIGVFEGMGFIGTLDGHVVAVDLADGSLKWKAKTSSEVVSVPQANSSVVIAQAIDGRVFAFNFDDGSLRWNYDHSVPVLSLRSNAAPLITNDNVYIGFDNGQLLSFSSSNGQLRWSARVGQPTGKTELERLVDVDAAPIELGPYVYGAGYNARLVAISKGTGRIAWGQDASTANNIAAGDDFIVVSDVNSHVTAFSAQDGSILWQNKELHRRGLTAPVVFGSLVAAVDGQGYIHGFAAKDGKLVARGRASPAKVLAQPFVHDETLYVMDADGLLVAYQMEAHEGFLSIWDMPTDREHGPVPTKYTGVKKPQ